MPSSDLGISLGAGGAGEQADRVVARVDAWAWRRRGLQAHWSGRYRTASRSGVQNVRLAACEAHRGVVHFPVPTPRSAALHRHDGSANTRLAAAIPDSHAAVRLLRRATDPLLPRAAQPAQSNLRLRAPLPEVGATRHP